MRLEDGILLDLVGSNLGLGWTIYADAQTIHLYSGSRIACCVEMGSLLQWVSTCAAGTQFSLKYAIAMQDNYIHRDLKI